MRYRMLLILCITVVLTSTSASVCGAGDPVVKNYYVYVAAESDDAVYLLKFGPEGGQVVKRIPVGIYPTEIEGPHGVRVSPNGRHWYVSIAHGKPYGYVFKYATGDDVAINDVKAGLFPATMDISRTTGLMFVVNFNLHGDMEPSTISVIDTVSMTEVAAIDQGIMPHGSRTSPDGKFHYSVGMMSDELYEIDVLKLKVSRILHLTKDHNEADAQAVKPTWVEPHPTKRFVYVALQGVNQVAEVDLEEWKIVRRFQTQKGPYNLAVSSDGKMLLITCKTNHSTAIWDIEAGKELASVPSSRRITHGVTISPDNRFAFVSVEGVGGEPGTVDVIDLQTFELRASIDVGKQASGIDFWKME
ncbi:MAG: YncE family protein [Acidobacteria bacterium]|nr:YncE family protein [Acidobacteriota bacterium]